MYRLLWGVALLILWCAGGCEHVAIEEGGYEQGPALVNKGEKGDGLIPGGQETDRFDERELTILLQNEVEKWQRPVVERPFTIIGSDNHVYLAYWTSPQSWKIHWKKGDDLPLLIRKDDSVYYRDEKNEERLFEGELEFVLPPFHFQLLKESVQKDQYEWLSISQGEAKVAVSLYLPGDVLQLDFNRFLTTHHPLDEPVNLELYGLLYHFDLEEENGEKKVTSLTVSLMATGEELERISFTFK